MSIIITSIIITTQSPAYKIMQSLILQSTQTSVSNAATYQSLQRISFHAGTDRYLVLQRSLQQADAPGFSL